MSTDTDKRIDDDAAEATTDDQPGDPSSAEEPAPADDDQIPRGHGKRKRRVSWTRLFVYGLLPALALLLTLGAAFLKWENGIAQHTRDAELQSVPAATDSAIAMLSYQATKVQEDLTAASQRLTGPFRDDYLKLIDEVVIPGAIQKQISAVATVPAAAAVSATQNQAVIMVFINQTTTIGTDPPTNTASSVRMTMDKVGDRWLVSQFEPI